SPPRLRIPLDPIRQLRNPRPVAANGDRRRLRARLAAPRRIPLLRRPPQVPQAPLYGAAEDPHRPRPRPAHLRQSPPRLSPDRAGDDRRAAGRVKIKPVPLLDLRPDGLYCPAGDFYVDPWGPVDR